MQIADPLFYISGGFIAFAGLMAFLLARVGFSPRLFSYFALLCAAIASFQFATAAYLAANSFSSAVAALHWQTASLALVIPLGVGFVSLYTGFGHHRKALSLGAAVGVIFLVLDYLSSASIRFVGSVHFETFVTPWGESLHRIQGSMGWQGFSLYMVGVVFFVFCVQRGWALWHNHDPRALFFNSYVVIQFGSVAYGVVVDFDLADSFKIIGFGFLVLVLLVTTSMMVEIRSLLAELGTSKKQLNLERSASEVLKVNQQRLSQVVALSPHSIQLVDTNGKLLQQNRTAGQLWGHTLQLGDNLFTLAPWRALRLVELVASVINRGEMLERVLEVDAESFRECDHNRWIRFKIFPVVGRLGRRDSVTLIAEDITREQSVENTLKTLAAGAAGNGDFFELICAQVQQMFHAKCVFLAQYNLGDDGGSFETLAANLDGNPMEDFSLAAHTGLLEEVFQGYTAKINGGLSARYPADAFIQTYELESFMGIPLYDDLAQVIGCMAILNDRSMESRTDIQPILALIADRIAAEMQRLDAESRVRRMAYEDYVTRLPNRASLHEHLAKVVRDCAANDWGATAFFLDLDHFKTINEALGHDVGDEVLRLVGLRLRDHFADSCFVARAGGDEFVLVQTSQSSDISALSIDVQANKVINLLSKPIMLGERTISIGTSVGVIMIPKHGNTILDIMRRGDSALFKAKQAGRNCYAVYDPRMQKSIEERMQVEKGLRIALEQNQFGIFYQPKVDARGKVVGAEGLVRWSHPEHGFISPSVFIPVAEETGLIHLIGEWIMEAIAGDLVRWQDMKIEPFGDIAINISAWQFGRADFIEKTLAGIRLNNIRVEQLSIEVTETAILGDMGTTRVKLNQLRNAGISVMLDDFGTGYSSLAYLKDLPLDGFKIDRTFVEGLGDAQAEPLVRSMLSIGKHMRLKVVAEGVESKEQFDKLKAMGCNLFQGYLFAKPMPVDEFLMWVKNNLEEHRYE